MDKFLLILKNNQFIQKFSPNFRHRPIRTWSAKTTNFNALKLAHFVSNFDMYIKIYICIFVSLFISFHFIHSFFISLVFFGNERTKDEVPTFFATIYWIKYIYIYMRHNLCYYILNKIYIYIYICGARSREK